MWLTGNKEVLRSFRRRMKPGGLRQAPTLGYTPLARMDATESHSLGFRPRERLSIRGRGFPAPCQTCCGVLCVLRQKRCTDPRSDCWRRAVPIAAPRHPDGHSSVGPVPATAATITHGPRTQVTLDHSPLLGTKGDCKEKSIQSLFFFCTWRTAGDAAYITPGPRGKCQNRMRLGGSMLAHSANRSISGGWNKGGGNWNMGGSGHAEEKDQGHFGWRGWHCKGKETVN